VKTFLAIGAEMFWNSLLLTVAGCKTVLRPSPAGTAGML